MIAIIDYNIGNIGSVCKAFERFGHDVRLINDPRGIAAADKVVLPGVGAFGASMGNLSRLGFVTPLREYIATGKPFLGICVGLQLLLTESEEKGMHPGLNIIPGQVLRFPEGEKIPQIGWNQVRIVKQGPLFRGIPDNAYFYFVHSFYARPGSPSDAAGLTAYGVEYASVLQRENIFGVQFHPEKSQKTGLKLIENFCSF